MEKDLSIFLIGSPLQLLCSLELRHKLNIQSSKCILLWYQHRQVATSIIQYAKLINLEDWEHIEFWSESLMCKKIHMAMHLVRTCMKYRFKTFRVVHGFERLSSYAVIRLLKPLEVWEVDDGTADISGMKPRNANTFHSDQKLRKYRYFSMFEQNISGNKDLQNDFPLLRKRLNKSSVSAQLMVFVGGFIDLSESGIIVYKKTLVKVREYWNGRILYLPHRHESKEWLNIVSQLGFDVHHSNFPVEIELSRLEKLPILVGSTISTAMLTCVKIYSNRIGFMAFTIDYAKHLPNANLRRIEKILKSFHDNDVKLTQIQL